MRYRVQVWNIGECGEPGKTFADLEIGARNEIEAVQQALRKARPPIGLGWDIRVQKARDASGREVA